MSRGGIKSSRISLPFLDFGIIGWDGCSSLYCDFEGENFIADKSSCMWRHLSVIFSILMMIFGPKKLKTISKSLSLCCFHSYECFLSILAWHSHRNPPLNYVKKKKKKSLILFLQFKIKYVFLQNYLHPFHPNFSWKLFSCCYSHSLTRKLVSLFSCGSICILLLLSHSFSFLPSSCEKR